MTVVNDSRYLCCTQVLPALQVLDTAQGPLLPTERYGRADQGPRSHFINTQVGHLCLYLTYWLYHEHALICACDHTNKIQLQTVHTVLACIKA